MGWGVAFDRRRVLLNGIALDRLRLCLLLSRSAPLHPLDSRSSLAQGSHSVGFDRSIVAAAVAAVV